MTNFMKFHFSLNDFYRITLLFGVLIFTQGCSKSFEGEAFGKNGKFGGVTIYIVEKKNISNLLNDGEKEIQDKKNKIKENIGKLNWEEIHKYSKEVDDSISALSNKLNKIIESKTARSWEIDAMLQPYQSVISEKTKNYKLILKDELGKLNFVSINTEYQNLRSNIFYYDKLKNAINSENTMKTLTDSDGKFSIKGSSSSYLLAISPNKNQFWILDLGKIKTRLQLTDYNTIGKICDECVITAEDFDINSEGPLAALLYWTSKYQGTYLSDMEIISMIESSKKAGFR